MTLVVISNNEHRDTCVKCGGKCCQRMPGEYHPDQWDLTGSDIAEALAKGGISADYWEGDVLELEDELDELDMVYYLRPRISDVPINKIVDGSWGGMCSNLANDGCKLTFADRPYGCQVLEPNTEHPGECNSAWSKKQAALSWRPYQDLIEDAINQARSLQRKEQANQPSYQPDST